MNKDKVGLTDLIKLLYTVGYSVRNGENTSQAFSRLCEHLNLGGRELASNLDKDYFKLVRIYKKW